MKCAPVVIFIVKDHILEAIKIKKKKQTHQSKHKPLTHLTQKKKLKETVFFVTLTNRKMCVERRVMKTARTNHTEVYRSMGTPLWKMENSCSLFLMRNQAKHMKTCIPPQLKFNSASLRRAQCVGHCKNSVWKKTDTRKKNCRGRSNILENLPGSLYKAGIQNLHSQPWKGIYAISIATHRKTSLT